MADRITLARNYKPSHYSLSLRDLDFRAWTFKGTVKYVERHLQLKVALTSV